MSAIERLIVACSFIKMAIEIGIPIGFSTMISVIFELSNSFASAKSTAIKGKSQESFQSLGGKRQATKTSEKKCGMQLFEVRNLFYFTATKIFGALLCSLEIPRPAPSIPPPQEPPDK